MTLKQECLCLREEYINLVKAELMGPGSEISIPDVDHELLSTSPDKRYSMGILYTKYNRYNMDNDDTARVESNPDDNAETEVDIQEEIASEESNSIDSDTPVDEDNLDEEIVLATQNMPSSMGLTFLVDTNIQSLKCKVQFATYRKAMSSDCRLPFYPTDPDNYEVPSPLDSIAYFDKSEGCLKLSHGGVTRKIVTEWKEKDVLESDEFGFFSALYKLADQLRSGYVRVPHEIEVGVEFTNGDYSDNNQELDGTKAKITALKRKVSNELYSITIMLVNDDDSDSRGDRCLFQPRITIDSKDNDFKFQEYAQMADFAYLDKEEQSLELQYRNKHVYGTGLGTSVDWNIDQNGQGTITNEFFPQYEVPSMDFTLPDGSNVDQNALSMKVLSDLDSTPKEDKLLLLKSIVDAYKDWISSLECRVGQLEIKFHQVAKDNIKGCKHALERMQYGLELLRTNTYIWDAFSLANRAMFMQRAHLSLQEHTSNIDRYPGDEELSSILESLDYDLEESFTKNQYFWRPFQIAFMLMSIASISDDSSQDRDLVDLIWFPTGGGKTEAYLLLTAFTIFYRRLMHQNESDGTTVIMRYTLRLLAAQQFTRASTLICACEYIREDCELRRSKYKRYDLGSKPITIGLWIGNEHIPNTNNMAKKHLKNLLDANTQSLQYIKDRHNKFQVLKCPWCGTKMVKDRIGDRMIGTFGYRMRNNRHFELFCPQESCHFNQRGTLPIQIIDDELYDNPPTLLFGTVDKFAMIPWKEDIGKFFAVDSNNRPPELIIQDELHLISGPLGTMVGLYEAVIDSLCQAKGVRPKIVASTATIRRAKEQCAALYNRKVNQFPHPGLDAEDSFFAREAVIDHSMVKYGRSYIGLMPSGKSKAMMEIRSIATLMQIINTVNLSDEVRDKYWTLTVYFNSLKDLGKCSTLVEDDVKEYIRRAAYRLGTGINARAIGRPDELTSRVTTTQLNETLEKLEKIAYSKDNIINKRFASNILLATNMISVGIDVARLNVMLMVNQTKLTSEYIQASSRVGRTYPGIVFAMYDGSKSRDRSHYEQFRSYHESFYKYVEPTGATPFSKPARDRALHAVVIAIMRSLEADLRSERGAALFTKEKYKERVAQIKKYLVMRSSDISARLNSEMEDDSEAIKNEIENVFDRWQQLAENFDEEHFCYGERFMVKSPDDGEGRLLKSYNTSKYDPAFDTMTSMRNVDATVGSNILIWED